MFLVTFQNTPCSDDASIKFRMTIRFISLSIKYIALLLFSVERLTKMICKLLHSVFVYPSHSVPMFFWDQGCIQCCEGSCINTQHTSLSQHEAEKRPGCVWAFMWWATINILSHWLVNINQSYVYAVTCNSANQGGKIWGNIQILKRASCCLVISEG